MVALLAIDLGLRMGLAGFSREGELLWARSQHLGGRPALRRIAWSTLAELPNLEALVAEGDRTLYEIWARVAQKRGVPHRRVSPETWRRALLFSRQQRDGQAAKQNAINLASRVVAASTLANKPSLRHDAAEAICIGLWRLKTLGWPTPAIKSR